MNTLVEENTQMLSLFTPPEIQVEVVRLWNEEKRWGLTEADFIKLGPSPEWLAPEGRSAFHLMAVVLEVSLPTVQMTFDEAWKCAEDSQESSFRWPELLSDPGHLRLLPGIAHEPGLRWRVIDLGANQNVNPEVVRNSQRSPAQALLWAAALFPEWVRAMNGFKIPYVWLPGYQLYDKVQGAWSRIPSLGFIYEQDEIRLSVRHKTDFHSLRRKAVPTFETI